MGENRENQTDMVDKGVLSQTVNNENNKRQYSDSDDIGEAKKAKNLHSNDADGKVDDKEAKHHDLSDSEEGDASQEEEECKVLKKDEEEEEKTYTDLVPLKEGAKIEE